ncbi:MAG: hypothetical protein ABFD08_09650 [Syntrophomonas sp.]
MSMLQRIILICGLLLLIMISIIKPPMKTIVIENPEYKLYPAYHYKITPYINQNTPDNDKIIRYDLVIIFGTAVLFFAVKPGKQKVEERDI